jgi:hypothetical protein
MIRGDNMKLKTFPNIFQDIKKIIHISHNDQDGIAPSILGNLVKPDDIEYVSHYCDYNEVDDKIAEAIEEMDFFTALLITDITPRRDDVIEGLQALHKIGQKVVLLDHHSTQAHFNEYDWALIKPFAEIEAIDTDEKTDGIRKTSATEMYFWYLILNNMVTDEQFYALFQYVKHVTDYDTWLWIENGNDFASELNKTLYIVGKDVYFFTQLNKLAGMHIGDIFEFTSEERLLVDIENKKEAEYIQEKIESVKTKVIALDGRMYKVAIVQAESFVSTLGNAICKAVDCDFVAMFDFSKEKISFRSVKKDVNVGVIAKTLHEKGGGHPPASGCPLTQDIASFFLSGVWF